MIDWYEYTRITYLRFEVRLLDLEFWVCFWVVPRLLCVLELEAETYEMFFLMLGGETLWFVMERDLSFRMGGEIFLLFTELTFGLVMVFWLLVFVVCAFWRM